MIQRVNILRRAGLGLAGMTAAVLLATGVGGALASVAPASRAGLGPTRSWGGTEIRSLDPPSAATAGRLPVARLSRLRRPSAVGSGVSQPPPPDQVLSNETTLTRWAYVASVGPIRQKPTTASVQAARLHWNTEDGFPEVYLVLRAHWDAAGREWIKVRIPMRPNGETGWVRRQDLSSFQLVHTQIVVDRRRLRMHLFERGRLVWSAPVAVGKPSTPTPAGHFWIRERFKINDPRSGYGPYAFGTSDYSTLSDWPGGGVIGIHGPYYQPSAIPGRVSHGCIRLRATDDAWLARHAGLGTPVKVI